VQFRQQMGASWSVVADLATPPQGCAVPCSMVRLPWAQGDSAQSAVSLAELANHPRQVGHQAEQDADML